MTTIAEARQALEQQRQTLREQQQRAENARRALEQQRKSLPDVRSRQALQGGLQEREKRRLVLSKERGIQEKQGVVSEYEQQLQKYEQEQLTPYEQQIKQVEAQQEAQKQAQAQSEDYNYALRVYLGQTSGSQIGRVDPEIRAAAQREAEKIESRSYISALSQFGSEQGLKPVIVNGQITGFQDTIKQMSIPVPNLGMGSAEDIKRYENAGITFKEVPITTKELPPIDLMGSAKNALVDNTPSLFTGGRGVVDLPPSKTSQFISQIKEKGPFGGVINYVSEKLGSYTYEREMNQDKPYQSEAQSRAVKFVTQTLPFFSPVGAGLMVVSGGEKFLFGSREYQGKPSEFSQEKTQLREAGYNPLFSNVIVYGKPALEVGFGALGIKSQIRANNNVIPQTEFIGTLQRSGDTSTIDILAKTSKTTKGVNFPSGNIVIKEIDKPIFTLAREIVKPVEGTNKFVSIGKGYNVIGDVSRSVEIPTGRVITKVGEIKPFISISKGEELGSAFKVREFKNVKLRKEIGEGTISGDTGLVSRQQGDIFSFEGGKVTKKIVGDPLELFGNAKTSYLIRNKNIKGYLKEVPVIESTNTGVKVLQPSGGKKTPFSLTFQEQKAVTNLMGDISKTATESFKVVETKPNSLFGVTKSSQIQEPRTESVYAGTGLYERTEEYGSGTPKQNILFTNTKERNVNILGLNFDQPIKEKTREINILSDVSVEKELNKQPNILKELFETPQAEKIRLGLAQRLSQRQQETQKYKQPQINKIKSETTPQNKPIIILPILGKSAKEKLKNIAGNILKFESFGKRYGKEFSLGKFTSQPQAEKSLKDFLKGTLGASGKIKAGEKTLKFGELKTFKGLEFRPAKKDITRVVQERGFRLGTKQEVFEIKKSKKKRKKFNWFS